MKTCRRRSEAAAKILEIPPTLEAQTGNNKVKKWRRGHSDPSNKNTSKGLTGARRKDEDKSNDRKGKAMKSNTRGIGNPKIKGKERCSNARTTIIQF